MRKNRVSIIINDFGGESDYCFELNNNYDPENLRYIDAKEKVLVYADSNDVCAALLKAYHEAYSVCEKMADMRKDKYKKCYEYDWYDSIITIRLDRLGCNLSDDLKRMKLVH
ncbi:hypothetical protein [Clostridium baratii]|uniref:hypothetical protein n=1 Tax=Clostridium baratii TaxID=1561 RepID=UPI002941EF5C|nr:hypothetical protein [Clostridium baratii]